jgi:hypothetical protein
MSRKNGRPLNAKLENIPGPEKGKEWDWLHSLTVDSPLLAVGTVLKRQRLAGKSDNGPWEFFLAELRGADGRTISVQINDPKECPNIGELAVFPVHVTSQGRIREAKNLAEEF